jgi:hypothetical protein
MQPIFVARAPTCPGVGFTTKEGDRRSRGLALPYCWAAMDNEGDGEPPPCNRKGEWLLLRGGVLDFARFRSIHWLITFEVGALRSWLPQDRDLVSMNPYGG